jgi:hypothetical protein
MKIRTYFLMVFQKMRETMIFMSSSKDGAKSQNSKCSDSKKEISSPELQNLQLYNKQKAVWPIQENTHCIKTE